LRQIAAAKPSSLAELSTVNGVGDSKVRKYGEALLETVRSHEAGEASDGRL
jgi:ATP-dependent DNA helicase RecQ